MADKTAKDKKLDKVRALYEAERRREKDMGPEEAWAPPPGGALEGAELEIDLDEPVSNQGSEAAVDVWAFSYGKKGKPTGVSIEAEAAAVPAPAAEATLEAFEEQAPEADEDLALDAYWASHGDAGMHAMLRSQPATTSILEVVIGEDDRREVGNTTDYPWRAICSLLITAADGSNWIGTGWLVGPRILLTAAHCVYIHSRGGWVKKIEVIPGRRGKERPFDSATATTFWSVRGWTERQAREYDYAAIILPPERCYGDELGWFGLAAEQESRLLNGAVNISGYPGDLRPAGKQWFHARGLTKADERVLIYDIDTAGGQSGAPVWIKRADGSRYGVGVHTNGAVTGNSATRITQRVLDNITNWKASAT